MEAGGEALGPFPEDRGWDLDRLFHPDPDHAGTSYCERGGFLAGATEFDAEFFGIGPREARAMDPQQRLLLEVAWETFEDAGLEPAAVGGSRTGVFAGSMRRDYWSGTSGPEDLEPYLGVGNAASVLSGRLAYTFGLEGPALTVDTACSSSLVAMHLAAASLRAGECELALAGGVSTMSTPWPFVEFSRQRGLARDGRCRSFDAAADGTGFSEGAGLVLLERLSNAERNGHRVLALLRGSATNQDGASNGLTAPNGPAQERVIRQALANSGLRSSEVDAVEAHGTGTALGDPIEAGAILATYGQDRGASPPVALGSVKSNLGHAMAAAGVAGVIKVVEALRHERLPSTLHLAEPTPHVDWEAGAVELLTEEREWKRNGRPRRAAVSSFGISGTNAHLILEEAPVARPLRESPSEPPLSPLLLSAKGESALRESGARLAGHLRAHPEQRLADVGASLAATRARLPRRAAVLASDRADAIAALEALGAGEPHPLLSDGLATGGRLCFLFSGQGSQRPGMGRELHDAFPVFAAALDEVCVELDSHLQRPLREVLFAPEGSEEAALLDRTEFTQPALFAIHTALFALLGSWGLEPDYLLGHSIGELSAARLAGVLSLPDAARLVAARGALMGALPEGGAMVAIEASEEEAVAELADGLSLAAVNSPRSVVLSGPREAAEEAERLWSARGRKTTALRVSHAFHSELIEPMLAPFAEVARSLTYTEPRIPIVSDLSGEPLTAELARDPEYWVAQAREPVRFAAGVRWAEANGAGTFLELGPGGALSAMARASLGSEATVAPTLRRGRPEPEALAAALAEVHLGGAELDWERYFGERPRVPLPPYPFQRRRFWLDPEGPGASDPVAIGQVDPEHPFLASLVALPDEEGWLATGRVSGRTHPWLTEHVVLGTSIFPGTGFVELGLKAVEIAGAACLAELAMEAPLVVPEQGAAALQLRIGPLDAEGERPFEIHSHPDRDPGAEWVRNASGTLSPRAPSAPEPLAEWPPAGAEALEISDFYDRAAELGIDYGPAFQGLRAAYRRGEELFAEVELDSEQAAEAESFGVHPALLDAAVHVQLLGAYRSGELMVPFGCSAVRLAAAGASSLRVCIAPTGPESCSLVLADSRGDSVIHAGALHTRAISLPQLRAAQGAQTGALFDVDWVELTLPRKLEGGEKPGLTRLAADPALAPPAAARQLCEQVLATLREAIAAEAERAEPEPTVFLTEGAVATSAGEVPDPALASVWGLVRSAQAEHPGRFHLIDTDGSEASEAAIAAALAIEGEEQIGLRRGQARVPRLAPVKDEPAEQAPLYHPEATIAITGGTGQIGSLLARHLAEAGSRHLILTSRRGPEAPGATELIAELEELGAQVEVRACDAADPAALAELIGSIPAEHPLAAVMHTAGATDDGLVDSLDPERLANTMAPKADGAWALHELTGGIEGCELILFSSIAGTFQTPGQGNYAAANAFLDALAQQRAAEGLAGMALGWGGWEMGGGMTGRLSDADWARLLRGGLSTLSEEEGLSAFDRARGLGRARLLPVHLDAEAMRAAAKTLTLVPLLSGLVRGVSRRVGSDTLAERFDGLKETERQALVVELVRAEVATVLGHASAEAIDPAASFKDLGFDSLAALELRNRLGGVTGLRLPATVVFDHPNVGSLASLLRQEVEGDREVAPLRVRTRSEEPIAIVGIGCRYPGGVGSAAELWELVEAGGEALGPFPEDRGWDLDRLFHPDPDHAGTSYCERGGFLERATEFDAEFFGIGPREARAMDPQQRLLLEVAWETFEDAGLEPAAVGGTETGAFVGVMHNDYALAGSEPPGAEGYQGVGTAASVLSGRLAYTFGLEGPALTVDTACSSSLVAMHLAAASLRAGECELALAGGASVRSTPVQFVEFSRQRGLARDGRCKSFDAAADGTGFSEGAGLVLLERLSDAERNGHRVLALLRGSATNQDGASNGLTAPNGPAQERVIRAALANAGLSATEVDAVEAHGTGTALGDPIEAGAILATYGQERGDASPLQLGSVKSNLGHTMAAAGVAGVIKVVEALRHGRLPRTLHLAEPTPHVDWEAGQVELLTEAREWTRNGHPRRAGVSSFGISGTNAHLILEEAPAGEAPDSEPSELDREEPPEPLLSPLLLSAKGEAALRESGAQLAEHLRAHPEQRLADVGASLAATRARLPRRAAVLASERDEAIAALESLGAGEPHPLLSEGQARAGRLCFLFSGQGSQRPGMGRELHDAFPVFAEALDEVCVELDPHLGRSLRDLLFAPEGSEEAALLDRTEFTQPALFAIQTSLFALLRSWGMEPDYLLGHSIGELSAAHLAGVLSLPDAARLVAARGALMGALPPGGAMVAIEASEEEAVAELADGLSLAAVNSPRSVVLSGPRETAEEAAALWSARGRKTTELRVSHAFHSELIEPMLGSFGELARSLAYAEPEIPVLSGRDGEPLGERARDPEYWVAQVREPVRFAAGVRWAEANGATAMLELGDGSLGAMARASLEGPATVAATLRRGRPEPEALVTALAEAHLAGAELDWGAYFGERPKLPLPTYPFQRTRFWLDSKGSGSSDPTAIGQSDPQHPFLASLVALPGDEGWIATGRVAAADRPWLAEHVVLGRAILPGTGFVELGLKAVEIAAAACLEELAIEAPLLIPEQGAMTLQMRIGAADEAGNRPLEIHSRPDSNPDAEWTRNASGTLSASAPAPLEPLGSWPPAGAEALEISDFYDRAAELGIDYGPAFQGLRAAYRRGEELFAEVELAPEQEGEAESFGVHPALLDAAVHVDLLNQTPGEPPRTPFACGEVRQEGSAGPALRVHFQPTGSDVADVRVATAEGVPVASIRSLAIRRMDPAALHAGGGDPTGSLHRIEWVETPLPTAPEGEGAVGTVRLAPDSELAPPAAARALCEDVLATLQGAIASGERGRIAFVSDGAVGAAEGELPELALASAWGLIRSAQAEHPGRFLLVDSDGTEASEGCRAAALSIEDEPEIALRAGRAMVPRLAPAGADAEGLAAPLGPEGTVIVTGGTGTLGALLARHLVEAHGARHLLLTSRRGPAAPGATELATELEELGARVEVRACDAADPAALAALFASVPAEHPPRAVLHAAAVFDNAVLDSLDPERLANAMAPKADAAWALHELTAEVPGCALILFSSIAGTFPSPGQGNYAAANAFLDALARQRAAAGLPGISVGWGLWEAERAEGEGLGASDLARLRRQGMSGMETELALRLFDATVTAPAPFLLAAPIDPVALRPGARDGSLPSLLRGLVRAPASRARRGGLGARLRGMGEEERRAAVLAAVRDRAAAVLGHDGGEPIDPGAAFQEIGFDSLAGVELRTALADDLGLPLPATLVFDHPTPEAVTEFVLAELGGGRAEPAGADGKLDSVAAILATIPAEERARAAARLRPLLDELAGSAPAENGEELDFERASDEELLRLIDRELGAC